MQRDTKRAGSEQFARIEAIKSGDDKVLESLYQSNFHKIERYVLNNNGDTDQARDIYQEAFLAVWRNVRTDRFVPESDTALEGYLFRIAKNKWLDYLRSSQYRKVISIDQVSAQPEEELMETPDDRFIIAVREQFGKLGDNCRELLKRFYFMKESLRETAAHFGWTEATARNNKYRCIQRLKELVKDKI